MAYSKIDNSDVTIQIESERADVWVPNGIAIPDRSFNPEGESFVPGSSVAVSLEDDTYSLVFDSVNNLWEWRWDGQQKTPSLIKDVQATTKSDYDAFGGLDKRTETVSIENRTYRFLTDATSANDPRSTTTTTLVTARDLGPILAQNKVPIPVKPGMKVTMAGQFNTRMNGGKGETAIKDADGNASNLFIRFDLWGLGYYEDEYGEESSLSLPLISFTQNLQTSTPSNTTDSPNTMMVNFVLPNIAPAVVPEGVDRIFLSVSYVTSTDLKYASVSHTKGTPGYRGWFGSTPDTQNPNFMQIPVANPLRIVVKKSDTENIISENTLSQTGAAFKNRAFFSNLYPSFNYLTLNNPGFENDGVGWTGINTAAGDAIDSSIKHSGAKSLKVIGDSTINDVSISTPFTVAEGESYYAEVWVRQGGGYAGAGSLGIAATLSQDGASPSYPSFQLINATNIGTSWTLLYGRIIIPAGKNRMVVRLTVRDTVTGGSWYFDDVAVAKLFDDNELTIMGTPSAGTNVEIYEWEGSRRGLLKSVSVAANERKVVDVSSITGTIEIAKPGSVTPSNMGIIKRGTQVIPQNISTFITGFNFRSDMPGTVLVEDHKLVMQQSGQVSVSAYLDFVGTAGTYKKQVNIDLNGTIIKTFETSEESSGVSGQTDYINVVAGDVFRFKAENNSSTESRRTVSEATHFEIVFAPLNASGNDFYIESCVPKKWDEFQFTQNYLESITYSNVTEDTASISIERAEADAGVITVKFASVELDPITNSLLQPGRNIRILGRHYGPGNEIRPGSWSGDSYYEINAVGKIKRIEVVYDYKNEPQISVTAYDIYQKADSVQLGLAYDDTIEYAPAVHALGNPVYINGFDYTGPSSRMPEELRYFPSAYGSISLMDGLIMTRNTNKGFVYVNKKNELIVKDDISTDVKLVFTDGTLPGNLSMGNVKQGLDTETIINAIDIEENLLDKSDYVDRIASSAQPPEEFKTISGKERTVRYQDVGSIQNFGEYAKSFQVVRGTGKHIDIKNNNFGTPFENWAAEILENFAVPNIYISEITVPVKSSDHIRMLSSLDILDKVWVCYKGETYEVNIRSIQQEIRPGKWTFVIKFLPQSDMTYWS